MRVHAFTRRFPSLSQTFILGQFTGLLGLGIDLTVFADGPDGAGMVHPDVMASGLLQHTRYYGIPEPWYRRPLPALRLLRSEPSLRRRQSLRLLQPRWGGMESVAGRLLFEGVALAREPRPTILHAHFGPVGAMVEALRAAGIVNAPLITTFYGYDMNPRLAPQYRQLFAHGDAFLVLSERMRQQLVAMGAPAQRVAVHRLGVDTQRFTPVHVERGSALHLLSIARLVPKKGISDALRAVAVASQTLPDLRYTIIGDGPLRSSLEAETQALGLTAIVRFAGWLTAPDVLATARTAHALLAPSVTAADGDAEGTPVAILEAQALALPVIATRHAGIPEIVGDGESGFLAAEHDVKALAEAIVRLADPVLARRMGQAARTLVATHHDIDQLNGELLARYKALLHGGLVVL